MSNPTWSISRSRIALLWALHPLNTEVVDYLTQRSESMMALFYLLTLYAVIRGGRSHRLAWANHRRHLVRPRDGVQGIDGHRAAYGGRVRLAFTCDSWRQMFRRAGASTQASEPLG